MFGNNSHGQLGSPTTYIPPTPLRVTFFDDPKIGCAEKVALGANFSLVLTRSGLYSFGANDYCQAGHKNSKTSITSPELIPEFSMADEIIDFYAGVDFSLVHTSRFSYWVFGQASSIFGESSASIPPQKVEFPLPIDRFGVGGQHFLILTEPVPFKTNKTLFDRPLLGKLPFLFTIGYDGQQQRGKCSTKHCNCVEPLVEVQNQFTCVKTYPSQASWTIPCQVSGSEFSSYFVGFLVNEEILSGTITPEDYGKGEKRMFSFGANGYGQLGAASGGLSTKTVYSVVGITSKEYILLGEPQTFFRKNAELLFFLLCARHFSPESPFYKDIFPLDMFKLIIRFAGLGKFIPKKADPKML